MTILPIVASAGHSLRVGYFPLEQGWVANYQMMQGGAIKVFAGSALSRMEINQEDLYIASLSLGSRISLLYMLGMEIYAEVSPRAIGLTMGENMRVMLQESYGVGIDCWMVDLSISLVRYRRWSGEEEGSLPVVFFGILF